MIKLKHLTGAYMNTVSTESIKGIAEVLSFGAKENRRDY